MSKYIPIAFGSVPGNVRFDVPRHCQGQIVEVAYGGFSRAEHCEGDPYKRVIDRSTNTKIYYAMVKP